MLEQAGKCKIKRERGERGGGWCCGVGPVFSHHHINIEDLKWPFFNFYVNRFN